MTTEMGEFVVGAYLNLEEGCDFVDYNVRPRGGGLRGLEELDVVGLNFRSETAYLCEVTTHIKGLLYVDNKTTLDRVTKKFRRQQLYAKQYLGNFKKPRFMFWSPVVPKGFLTENLARIEGLELILNQNYRECVDRLRTRARSETHPTGNPFFDHCRFWSTCETRSGRFPSWIHRTGYGRSRKRPGPHSYGGIGRLTGIGPVEPTVD